jgi:hypothetical protein
MSDKTNVTGGNREALAALQQLLRESTLTAGREAIVIVLDGLASMIEQMDAGSDSAAAVEGAIAMRDNIARIIRQEADELRLEL